MNRLFKPRVPGTPHLSQGDRCPHRRAGLHLRRQGNLKSATGENDNTTTFTYDGQERLGRIIGALGTITKWTRHNKGHITRIAEALPEEPQTDFSYDDNNRIKMIADPTAPIWYTPAG